MIQSLPLLSQIGRRTRLFMEQEPANYDAAHGHGPALPTLSSQDFIPGLSSERGNTIESGGSSGCCGAGLDFYNTREKAEIDREPPTIGSAGIPVGRQGSPARNWLSMADGSDKTADRGGNSGECAQNSPASVQPELSMRTRPSDEKSVPPTGSQQSAESATNAAPNACDGNRSRRVDQGRAHNFPASCAYGAEIDRPSEMNPPALPAVQRGTPREPWIHRLYRSEEAQKPWAPLKKMARKNNTAAVAPCKNSMEEANNSGHMVGGRSGAAARACVDCYTTKTPLWRTGPRGPKSLCNACGIRYRKTRRAALSECIEGSAMGSPKRKAEENSIHFKKRSRLPMASCKKNIGFENRSAFPRVFAQEEEEAAVLLMALSCGLVHG